MGREGKERIGKERKGKERRGEERKGEKDENPGLVSLYERILEFQGSITGANLLACKPLIFPAFVKKKYYLDLILISFVQQASKASGSLTDIILEAHRKKHLAFLMADLESLTGFDAPRSGDKQVCLERCFSLLLTTCQLSVVCF